MAQFSTPFLLLSDLTEYVRNVIGFLFLRLRLWEDAQMRTHLAGLAEKQNTHVRFLLHYLELSSANFQLTQQYSSPEK